MMRVLPIVLLTFLCTSVANAVSLTDEEKQYLQDKKVITYCIDPFWEPFEYLDSNGQHQGLTRDYLDLIKSKIDLKTKLVKTADWSETLAFLKNRNCDMILEIGPTPSRREYLLFTDPYIDFPQVVATRTEFPFVENMEDLLDKRVGMIRDYAIIEVTTASYPDFNPITVNSAQHGLQKVANGELDAFVDFLPSISRGINQAKTGNLKIAGKIDEKILLGAASRNDEPLLRSILQKSVTSISYEDKHSILDKWQTVKYEFGTDYALVWKIVIVSLGIFIIFIYWYRKLAITKKIIEQKNQDLEIAKKEIERKNAELKLNADTDNLTGIYNRGKLEQLIEQELERKKRYGNTFACTILDIDHFKKVNDTYGHPIGDEVLKSVSTIIKSSIRKSDLFGRWGGEEFVIIFPESGDAGLQGQLDSLRQKIEDYEFPDVKRVTASFGSTLCRESDTIDSIIKRADEALYKAKSNGRNMTVVD